MAEIKEHPNAVSDIEPPKKGEDVKMIGWLISEQIGFFYPVDYSCFVEVEIPKDARKVMCSDKKTMVVDKVTIKSIVIIKDVITPSFPHNFAIGHCSNGYVSKHFPVVAGETIVYDKFNDDPDRYQGIWISLEKQECNWNKPTM